MVDLSVSIRNYIDNVIRLSSKDIQQCAKSRDWFLQRIKNEVEGRYRQPVLYEAEPFVNYGSYFKGTKVADVDEYDVLVVIDSCSGQYSENGKVIGEGVGSASPNYKYQSSYCKPNNSGVSPQKMIVWLQKIVQDIVNTFGGEPVKEDGIAVTAEIKSRDLKLDLVPCGIFSSTANGRTFYNIGDGNDNWIITSPRIDIDRIDNIASNKEDFKNIIRICKRIKDQYSLLVKSFAIETAIADFVEKISKLDWNNANLSNRTIACMKALNNALLSGKILDIWNTNLLDSSVNYQFDAKIYENIINILNSQLFLNQYNSQEALNRRITSLFENKS